MKLNVFAISSIFFSVESYIDNAERQVGRGNWNNVQFYVGKPVQRWAWQRSMAFRWWAEFRTQPDYCFPFFWWYKKFWNEKEAGQGKPLALSKISCDIKCAVWLFQTTNLNQSIVQVNANEKNSKSEMLACLRCSRGPSFVGSAFRLHIRATHTDSSHCRKFTHYGRKYTKWMAGNVFHLHISTTYFRHNSNMFWIYKKKVLSRERKKHTARRVASTRCAALSPRRGVGGYLPCLGGGVPALAGRNLPWPGRYLPWMGGRVTYSGWRATYLGWGGGYLCKVGTHLPIGWKVGTPPPCQLEGRYPSPPLPVGWKVGK